MVAPVLVVLLLGIVEGGLLIKDVIALNQAARAGAREAATGDTPTTIDAHVMTSAPTIDTSQVSTLYEYRICGLDGSYGQWTVLSTDGDQNTASRGDQIRATLYYPHQLVTGSLFASLADNAEGDTVTLSSAIITRRQ